MAVTLPAHMGCRAGRVFALLLLLLVFARQGGSQPPSPAARVPTVVLLTSNLSWDDLRAGGPLNDLRQIAAGGSVALLNTAVSGETTEAAAFLSIGSGERMTATGERGPKLLVDDIPLTVADVAAQVYPAVGPEGSAVLPVYFRRFGSPPPSGAVGLALGLPTLERVQPSLSRVPLLGALGETLRRGGRTVSVFGDWRAALVGMDREGAVYGGSVTTELKPEKRDAALQGSDVVIASVTGRRSLRLLARSMVPLLSRGAVNLVVASIAPPVNLSTGKWARLGWIVAVGPGFPAHTLLTSATTRTNGLVANVDIAPTILRLQALPAFAGGAGHTLFSVPASDPFTVLGRIDQQTIAAANASTPLLVAYGVLAVGTTLGALVCLWLGVGKAPARFALLVIAAVLLALLPVGYVAPLSPWHYGLSVLGLSVLLAAVVQFLGGRFGVSPIGLLFCLLAAVICGDALLGSPLVSSALLSDFYLTGIRFYGLGNEYTGFLLGALLTGWGLVRRTLTPQPDSALPPLPPLPPVAPSSLVEGESTNYPASAPPAGLSDPSAGAKPQTLPLPNSPSLACERGGGGVRVRLTLLGILTTLLIGLPWFGADAGGALAATVTFVLAFILVRGTGTVRFRHLLLAFAAAFVVVALLGLVDRSRGTDAETHIGGAIAAGQAHGFGAIWDIVVRKVVVNIGVSGNALTLAVIAGMLPVWLLLTRGRISERLREMLARRPVFRGALVALLWGAFAAAVFNDSGAAMALMLLAPPTTAVIHEMLAE